MSSHHARCGSASLLGAVRPFTLAGTSRVYERPRPFGIRHLSLELRLDVADKSVTGTATLDIDRIDASATEIGLDAVGFEIRSVELLGQKKAATRHVYDGNTLRVPI